MTKKIILTAFLLLLLTPNLTQAYMNPEDVLLNRDLYLPPTSRDAQTRTEMQASEAAARRQREQERAFSLQHPAEPEPVLMEQPEQLHGSAPAGFPEGGYYVLPIQQGQPLFGSAPSANEQANLELQRTMRLLSRVNQNQAIAQFQGQVLHSGAGYLAPTGAGSVLAAFTMLGAAVYTLYSVRKAGAAVKTSW